MTEHNEQWQWQAPGAAWKGVGLYHVTLTVTDHQPLLGTLVIPGDDPAQARVESLPLGRAVLDCLRQVPARHPEIQVLHYCLMPDHLHAVWYVTRHMPKGILTAVRGFWQGAKKAAREGGTPDTIRQNCQERRGGDLDTIQDNCQEREDGMPDTIRRKYQERKGGDLDAIQDNCQESAFSQMPHLRPMGQRRQLPATIRYIDMNPQRLATKRLKPGFFCVQEGIELAGRTYAGVGNIALLYAERFAPVHVRRTWVEEAEQHGDNTHLRNYMNGCVLAARQGTIMVSPFISKQEKMVQEVLLREGHPFIYIADNGFRDYYKPADGIFDAVAAGKVLILSPWPYDPKKRRVTMAECAQMNKMAEEICAQHSVAPAAPANPAALSSVTPDTIRENSQEK